MTIGIVGAGNVGVGVADALVFLGIGKKIILYNRHIDKALGEVWDLNDCVPLTKGDMIIKATDRLEDLKEACVIVITVGAKQKPGETRLDLLDKNYFIIKDIIEKLDKVNDKAVIIMVTNPVDILTRVALKISKRDKNLIFGSGTVLDSSRLREAIGEKIGVDRKNIHAYVIGEHGDSEFVLWSACRIGPVGLESFDISNLREFKKDIEVGVRRRAYDIIEKKGFTKQAIGVAVANIVRSVINDEKSVYTISSSIDASCGCVRGEVCLSLPCVIGKRGVERKLLLKCYEDEFELLKSSAKKLDEIYSKLNM